MAKPRGRFSDVFAEFIADTMKAFGYLVRDFGFEHSETTIVSYECSIHFRKADRVAVSVECEAGALPWVTAALRERASDFLQGDVSAVIEVREAVKADYSRQLAEDWREERQALAAYRKKARSKEAAKRKQTRSRTR